MTHFRSAAIAASALLALLVLTGCTQPAPADSAPPSPSQSSAPPETQAPPVTEPAATEAPAATEPPEAESPVPAGWATYALGDGHTSWSLPPGWTADIARHVVEGNAEWTDYRGLIRDAEGTPMLRFEALGSGGQYGTDFYPCERPETEVFESLPLGEQVVGSDASVDSLAYASADGSIVFAAGISENDPETACEPDILALYQEDSAAGYDFLLLQIVDDEGLDYPRFASFDEARAYLGTDEYAAVRGVLTSFHSS